MLRPDILKDGQYLEFRPEDVIIRSRDKQAPEPDLPDFKRVFIYRGHPKGAPLVGPSKVYMELQLDGGKSATYCLDSAHEPSLEVIFAKP